MQVTSFDVVCANIKRLTQMVKEQGSGLRVRLSSAISIINIEELSDLVRLTKELGGDQVNTMYCRFYPQEIRHQTPLFKVEDKLDDEHSLFYHQKLSDSMVKEARSVARELGIIFTHEPLFEDHAGLRPCTSAKKELMVGWDGEIYPCGGAELHMKKKVEGGTYHFGNALTESIEEFWNNENYCKLRISAEPNTNEFPISECNECANVFDANKESCHMMQWKQFDHAPISLSSLRVKARRQAG
jgi:radical SAM protein with 4Fe4S-binding SPASM domain